MANTLFAYLKGAVSNGDDTDPENSASFSNPPMECKHNVTFYRHETLSLDTAETRSVTFPDAVTGWVGIIARVTGTDRLPGHAKITTSGVNWNGSSSITGITAGYGTDRHPGMICMTTFNVSTFTFTGLADGTVIEYLIMLLAEDDQL